MNPTPNVVIAFFQEMINRLFLKSPLFYKIWIGVSGFFVLVVGLPEALTLANIHLPQLFSDKVQQAVSWASTGIFLMAMLSTKSKPVALDQSGLLVTKTNAEKMPFTAIAEKKAAAKEVILPVVAVPPAPPLKP